MDDDDLYFCPNRFQCQAILKSTEVVAHIRQHNGGKQYLQSRGNKLSQRLKLDDVISCLTWNMMQIQFTCRNWLRPLTKTAKSCENDQRLHQF